MKSRSPLLFLLLFSVSGACLPAGDTIKTKHAESGNRGLTVISIFTVSPTAISFSLSDPDAGPVAASSAVTINWTLVGVALNGNWRIDVQAPSSTFPSCPRIPVSAIRVTCGSASISGLGLGGSATCAASSAPLSTSPIAIASGVERIGLSTTTVSLSFTITDSWRYTAPEAPACTFDLSYILSVD
ncbi:MAG TPA: hypothetical protein VFQ91_03365 [Bryobacteraceae bacterium]|nr:hypothetical protein [Bryobacteraceae bacterium]